MWIENSTDPNGRMSITSLRRIRLFVLSRQRGSLTGLKSDVSASPATEALHPFDTAARGSGVHDGIDSFMKQYLTITMKSILAVVNRQDPLLLTCF